MRDSMGRFIRGFIVNLGICPITMAEAWEAYYSHLMAWHEGYR